MEKEQEIIPKKGIPLTDSESLEDSDQVVHLHITSLASTCHTVGTDRYTLRPAPMGRFQWHQDEEDVHSTAQHSSQITSEL